jgi:3-phenylpropionate/trans-cinnamate dioxygenase ferredoxin component
MTQITVGKVSEIPPGTMKEFTINGKTVAVANIDGAFFAIEGSCSHAGAKLAEGTLAGTIIKCPHHGSEFDVRTGKLVKRPWIPLAKAHDLRSYSMTVECGDLRIEI